jgi:hypothetical protein
MSITSSLLSFPVWVRTVLYALVLEVAQFGLSWVRRLQPNQSEMGASYNIHSDVADGQLRRQVQNLQIQDLKFWHLQPGYRLQARYQLRHLNQNNDVHCQNRWLLRDNRLTKSGFIAQVQLQRYQDIFRSHFSSLVQVIQTVLLLGRVRQVFAVGLTFYKIVLLGLSTSGWSILNVLNCFCMQDTGCESSSRSISSRLIKSAATPG